MFYFMMNISSFTYTRGNADDVSGMTKLPVPPRFKTIDA
jgi:hypothetical protein